MAALFGKKPKPADPVRMPVEADPASKAAEERKRRDISARSGRSSTMLSRGSNAGAGTTSYQNSLLGQGG